MAESILNRISRLVSARVEDSVDRLERAGGEAVMREAIREAERAIAQAGAERDATVTRRLQLARQGRLMAERIEALTGKARFAVEAGRDDLAEAVLSQQLDFENQLRKLGEAQDQAREDEARLDEGLAALTARKVQMEETLAGYVVAQREASAAGGTPPRGGSAERAVDAAERAFGRAMGHDAMGRDGMAGPVDGGTVRRVAEVDVLLRTATIAERLAALKAQRAA